MPLSTYLTNILPEAKRRKAKYPQEDIGFIPGSMEEHKEAVGAGLSSYPLGLKDRLKQQMITSSESGDWPSKASSLMQSLYGANTPAGVGQRAYQEYTSAMNEKISRMNPEQRNNVDWDKINNKAKLYSDYAMKQAEQSLSSYEIQWKQEMERAKEKRGQQFTLEAEDRAAIRKRSEEERATVRVGTAESKAFTELLDENLSPVMGLSTELEPLRNQLDPESLKIYNNILSKGEEFLRSKKMTPLNALNSAMQELGVNLVEKEKVIPGVFWDTKTSYKALTMGAPTPQTIKGPVEPTIKTPKLTSQIDQYLSQLEMIAAKGTKDDAVDFISSIKNYETREIVKKAWNAKFKKPIKKDKGEKWGVEGHISRNLKTEMEAPIKKEDLPKAINQAEMDYQNALKESGGRFLGNPAATSARMRLEALKEQYKKAERSSRVQTRMPEITKLEKELTPLEAEYQKVSSQLGKGGFTSYLFDTEFAKLKQRIDLLRNKIRQLKEE